MKSGFREYYRPSPAAFTRLWSRCLFCFDANVLLNLYRYSAETRQQVMAVLRRVCDRLWLPHQAALEYQRNRPAVVLEEARKYDDMVESLRRTHSQLLAELESPRGHPYLSEAARGQLETAFRAVTEELAGRKEEHMELLENDTVRGELDALFDRKVGPPYSDERATEVEQLAQKRYAARVPPGYCDEGDKEGRRRFGDVFLWFQVLDQAKSAKCPVILVTDDQKEDWWWECQGRTIGPRPQLLAEMRETTGQDCHIYRPDQFLEHAQRHLQEPVPQSAIDEVRAFRPRDVPRMREGPAEPDLLTDYALALDSARAMLADAQGRLGAVRSMEESVNQDLGRAMDGGDSDRAAGLLAQSESVRSERREAQLLVDRLSEHIRDLEALVLAHAAERPSPEGRPLRRAPLSGGSGPLLGHY